MLGTVTSPPLMLTPRQAADLLGLGLPTLRRHAATLEALTGEELPRGEHLERLWPEPMVALLGEALGLVHRREAGSVAEALGALYLPQAPPPVPLPDTGEALRALIREEVRAVVREELAQGFSLPASASKEELRDVVRQELRAALDPARLHVLAHAVAPVPAPNVAAPVLEENVRRAVRKEVQVGLDPERLRVILHASTPQRRSVWWAFLAGLAGRR